MSALRVWQSELVREHFKQPTGQGAAPAYRPWRRPMESYWQARLHGATAFTLAILLVEDFQQEFIDFREQFPVDAPTKHCTEKPPAQKPLNPPDATPKGA